MASKRRQARRAHLAKSPADMAGRRSPATPGDVAATAAAPPTRGSRADALVPQTSGPTQYDQLAGRPPPTFISDVSTERNIWSPFQPVAPFGPPSVEYPRTFDYGVGLNLDFSQQGRLTFFKMLQVLSRSWGILRTVIETRKDQLMRIPWDVQLIDKPDQPNPRLDELRAFLKKPDRQNNFNIWMRLQLEDRFVIDAANYYVWKDRGGKPYAAMHVAGETIKPLIDDAGRRPEYPSPAYQQVIKGLPWQNLDAHEFIYAPMRPTPQEPLYGYSEVQQIYIEVLQGIRKMLYKLDYWTEGSIPQLIITVPAGWTPDQLAAFQAHFDVMMAGNTPFKSRVRFMPSDSKPFDLKNANGEALKTEEDEWVTRLVCYAFSVAPTPFVRQMNRSTAQSAAQEAEEEGLHPMMSWIKEELIDPLIQNPDVGFGYDDCEFVWKPEPEVDERKQMTVITGYTKVGMMTIDEGRDQINLPPLPNGAGAEALVDTPQGPVPLKETVEANRQKAIAAPQQLANEQEKHDVNINQQTQNLQQSKETHKQTIAQGKLGLDQSKNPASNGKPNGKTKPGVGKLAGIPFAPACGHDRAAATGGTRLAKASHRRLASPRVQLHRVARAALAARRVLRRAALAAARQLRRRAAKLAKYSADQQRDDHGRFGSGGTVELTGNTDDVHRWDQFYHGTSVEAVEHIRSEGLVASKGHGADENVDIAGFELKHGVDIAGRHASVYMTVSQGSANHFADLASAATGTPPVVLRVTVPMDLIGQFKYDELSSSGMGNYRFEGKIPPEWMEVRGDKPGSWKRLSKAGGKTFYVVIPIVSAEKLAKAYPRPGDPDFDPNPPAAEPPDPVDPEDVGPEEFDLGELAGLEDAFADQLGEQASEAAGSILAEMGLDDDAEIVDQVSEAAVAAAQDQAAELVTDIDDTTRGMLRDIIAGGLDDNLGLDEIATQIEESAAFGEDRAMLIAQTEVRNANERGVLEGLRGARDAGNDVMKEWLLGPNPCPICVENADAGPIPLDDEFPSGDTEPTAHPRCECAITGVIVSSGEQTDEGGDAIEQLAKAWTDAAREASAEARRHMSAPAAGKDLLYHTSAKRNAIFGEQSRPTWFYPSNHTTHNGISAVDEARSLRRDRIKEGDASRVHAFDLKPGTRLASETDVRQALADIHGGRAEDYKDNPVYSRLDREVGEYPEKDVDRLVSHLKDQGFDGVVHSDYSHKNNQLDRVSVALFNPRDTTTRVGSFSDSFKDEMKLSRLNESRSAPGHDSFLDDFSKGADQPRDDRGRWTSGDAAEIVALHNKFADEYKSAFKRVGAKMWRDDEAHKITNDFMIHNPLAAEAYYPSRPLTVLDNYPNVSNSQRRRLDKEIDEIYARHIAAFKRLSKTVVKGSSDQPRDDRGRWSSESAAETEFHSKLESMSRRGELTFFHESPGDQAKSFRSSGIISDYGVFSTINEPSNFAISSVKTEVQFKIPADRLYELGPDMIYGTEDDAPHRDLMNQHGHELRGANVSFPDSVPPEWITSVRVIKKFAKYSVDQERDDRGRFGVGGTSGHPQEELLRQSLGSNKLTSAENHAIRAWADYSEFQDINYKLRQSGQLNDEEKQLVNNLDSAIGKSRLPEDTTLYRGISEGQVEEFRSDPVPALIDQMSRMSVGDTMVDRGFSAFSLGSSAHDYGPAGTGFRGANITVQASRGDPVLPILASATGEMLVARDTSFRLVSRSGDDYVFKTVRSAKLAVLFKYSPDQERDARGRFGSGGEFNDYATRGLGRSDLTDAAKNVTNNPKFTDSELEALRDYTHDEFKFINDELRGQGHYEIAEQGEMVRNMIRDMDSGMAKSTLSEDLVVRRYVNAYHVENFHVGDEVTDPGFMSSTIGSASNLYSLPEHAAELRLEVPAGTHAISAGPDISNIAEAEIILPRGTTYRVTAIENNGLRVVARVVGGQVRATA